MSDEKHTAWDDAHSLGIALRLAHAQNRALRKALAAIADEWPYHADSTENIRNTAKQALAAIKPNQVEQPCTDGNAPHKRVSRQIKEQSRQQWKPIETAPKDGTAFLAVSQEHIKRDWLPDMVEWADGGWVYTDNFNEFLFTLSHWMPMPSLPLPAPPMSDK